MSGCETHTFYQASSTPGSEQHERWALGWGVQVSLEASPSAPAGMLLSPRERSQNSGIIEWIWTGKGLKAHLLPTSLPWARDTCLSSWAGCCGFLQAAVGFGRSRALCCLLQEYFHFGFWSKLMTVCLFRTRCLECHLTWLNELLIPGWLEEATRDRVMASYR